MDNYDRSTKRLKNLLHDVEAIKCACAEDKCCPFREFEYNDYVFRFEFHSKNEKRFYWVNLNGDYPNNSILTWTVNGSADQSMKPFDLPLPFVFNSVAKELYREIAIPILCTSRSPGVIGTSRPSEKDDDEYNDDSNYDDEEEYNENNGYGEDRNICLLDNLDIIGQGHEELREDFDLLKCYCPNAQINEIPALDEVEIGFPISTDFLEDELARAWRLIPQLPIYIRMFFSYTKYCEDCNAARVEVYQEKHGKNGAGVLIQLQSILTTFIKSAINERFGQRARDDSKFKTSKKTPPTQPLSQPKPKIPRLSTSGAKQSDPNSPPNLGQGLLVEISSYAQQRLLTLNNYCVICDELHTITKPAMLKPMVCDRALCVFSYQTVDVMKFITDGTTVQGEVIDLLIAMAKAAALSTRCDLIFDPYPMVVNPDKPQEFVFSSDNKKKSLGRLKSVLSKLANTEIRTGEMLKSDLDSKDRLLYPLFIWIVSSCCSHIVVLQDDRRLSFMKTPHQYLLRSSPPVKEAVFNQAKAIHGSVFAFHGSSIENWHGILRKGLINASGTSLQLNGAAYGKGIYLSPEASLSFSYSSFCRSIAKAPVAPGIFGSSQPSSKPYSGTSLHLLPPQGIICIALCEVVASKSLKKMSNQIWVMPEEDYVVTRFLFVFEDAEQKRIAFRSDDPHILAEIRRAIQC